MGRRVIFIIGGLVLLVVIVMAILLVVSGRGSKGSGTGPTTIKIWSPFDEGKIYKGMVKGFENDNPGYTVEFKYVEAANAKEYEAKVVDAIAAGNGPDIWLARNDWLPKHKTKITPFPSAELQWSTSKETNEQDVLNALLSEAVAKQNSMDGKLYALPIAVDSLALYINPTVLEQVKKDLSDAGSADEAKLENYPSTWEEVVTWSNLLKSKKNGSIDRGGLAMGTVTNTYAATDVYLALLHQMKGSLFGTDGKSVALHLARVDSSITKFPGKDSLDFFTSFARKDNANYSWDTTLGDPTKAFVDGRVAMMVGFSSLGADLKKLNKDFDPTVVALPQSIPAVSAPTDRVDYAAYWTHVVSSSSPNQKMSWQLLQSLVSASNLGIYQRQAGKPTVNLISDPVKPATRTSSDDYDLFASQVGTSQSEQKPEWQGVDEAIQDMISQVTTLGQSPQAAIDTAADRLKKVLPQ